LKRVVVAEVMEIELMMGEVEVWGGVMAVEG
jgi:hypothetical protein